MSNNIEDMVSEIMLKAKSMAAISGHAVLGIITIQSLSSRVVGLAVCFGMGKIYIFVEGRYIETWITRKRDEMVLWFALKQYLKSCYLASLIVITCICNYMSNDVESYQ
jgi:hypothetical protein